MTNSDAPKQLYSQAEHAQAVALAFGAARREVALISFDFESRVYNQPEVAEACKNFLLLSRHSSLRVLLNETGPAARGHRLVELGRHLSSFCEFRVLGERQRELRCDWLIIDERQIVERRDPQSREVAHFDDHPARARAARRQFDSWWQAADPASALRALHLG